MTRSARILSTPLLDVQAFAARATARASHAATLAELATDAAGGHVGQRWGLSRVASGTFHGFTTSASTARAVVVRAVLSARGTPSLLDATTLALTVTDGTTTASTLADGIPDGLRADRDLFLPAASVAVPRAEALASHRWVIDLDTLRALLTASTRWRWSLVASVGASHWLESVSVEELARFASDTADDYGQTPSAYLPRGMVLDGDPVGLQRIGATLEAAHDQSLRTYVSESTPEASPWSTTSTTWAALSGDDEPGGAACSRRCRPRALHGGSPAPVTWCVRYRLVGASAGQKGFVRITSGVGTYSLTLTDTSGAWADSADGAAYLKTSGTDGLDTITFEARVDAGVTLEVCARRVVDVSI